MLVILVKDISFIDFDKKPVVIPAETEVYVDLEENVAFANGYHFDIDASEFALMN